MAALVAVNRMSSILEPTVVPELNKAEVAQLEQLLAQHSAVAADPTGLHRVALPDTPYQALVKIIRDLASGRAVFLTTPSPQVTTSEAANLLGCSRQFVVRLLNERRIPFHRVGSHRRVYLRDLISYRNERDRRRMRPSRKWLGMP